jgi:hypothetical protein
MTAISTTTPSITNTLAQLISGGSSDTSTPTATGGNSAASSTPSSQSNSGPATFVTLSDQAKAAVARAQSDQAAADNLQAFVEAHHVNPADIGTKANAVGSLESLLGGSTQETGAQAANPPSSSSGAKVEAIVGQITSLADANEPQPFQPFQPFTPTKSLSNSVTVDGYTVTLDTNASTQDYGIQLSGNGVQAYSKHFGSGGDFGEVSAPPPGVSVIAGNMSNNRAVDGFTITQNVATASSASISSSAGSAAATAVNAQSSSITFLVNYATGQITVQQSLASVSARSTATGSPVSTLSTLA